MRNAMLLLIIAMIVAACGKKKGEETQAIVSGGLRPDGYADVYTISGTHFNGERLLSIDSLSENSGSFHSSSRSGPVAGGLFYDGVGRFVATGNGGYHESWTSVVYGGAVRLDAGSFGIFYIQL